MRGPLTLVCTGASLIVASVAFAQDPYYDFRIPEARSFTWSIASDARWAANDSRVFGSESDQSSRRGSFRSAAHRHAESERGIWDLASDAFGLWDHSESNNVFGLFGSEFRDRDLLDIDVYEWVNSTSATRFLGDSRWGYDASAALSYQYSRSGRTEDQRSTGSLAATEVRQTQASNLHFYQGEADASLGAGFGRVRDVTGVFDAQVLEQRLAATGRLRHPLAPATRQRLAQLFSVRFDYGEVHDRPDRYFWREVERVLAQDDALAGGPFDAWSLERSLEPATLSIALARSVGWRVTAGYAVQARRGHSDRDQWAETVNLSGGVPTSSSRSESSARTIEKEDRGFVTLGATVARPYGMRGQVSLSTSLRYGDGPRQEALWLSSAELDHVVADRWVASATATHLVASRREGDVRVHPNWQVTALFQLAYFVEDALAITASEQLLQARPLVISSPGPTTTDGFFRQSELRIGLTYRPVGRFEAPGLGISERLTRMPL